MGHGLQQEGAGAKEADKTGSHGGNDDSGQQHESAGTQKRADAVEYRQGIKALEVRQRPYIFRPAGKFRRDGKYGNGNGQAEAQENTDG